MESQKDVRKPEPEPDSAYYGECPRNVGVMSSGQFNDRSMHLCYGVAQVDSST